ncbi:C-type lectin 37Db-like [Bradysia coprophila]|uniref:C-type lectin 37Db-like n=1 Tax=Bradysia coprophila TaxID=38358 RepID=UPI00187DA24B|nr:C-type lectin 37Db-like [Bradysia coprophila]
MFKLLTIIVLIQISALKSEPQDAMPSVTMQTKEFVLGIFFKANWYRAMQFCRFHGMHLASIESQLEHEAIVALIVDYNMKTDEFWISGNDLAFAGNFSWMGNGQPLTYMNWYASEPNNIGAERCVLLWSRNIGSADRLWWHNSNCTDEHYFVCEE